MDDQEHVSANKDIKIKKSADLESRAAGSYEVFLQEKATGSYDINFPTFKIDGRVAQLEVVVREPER